MARWTDSHIDKWTNEPTDQRINHLIESVTKAAMDKRWGWSSIARGGEELSMLCYSGPENASARETNDQTHRRANIRAYIIIID